MRTILQHRNLLDGYVFAGIVFSSKWHLAISDEFEFRPYRLSHFGVTEQFNSQGLAMGEPTKANLFLNRIIMLFAGHQNRHKISGKFKYQLNFNQVKNK